MKCARFKRGEERWRQEAQDEQVRGHRIQPGNLRKAPKEGQEKIRERRAQKEASCLSWLSGQQSGRGGAVLRVRPVPRRAARVNWRTDRCYWSVAREMKKKQILTGLCLSRTCRGLSHY